MILSLILARGVEMLIHRRLEKLEKYADDLLSHLSDYQLDIIFGPLLLLYVFVATAIIVFVLYSVTFVFVSYGIIAGALACVLGLAVIVAIRPR